MKKRYALIAILLLITAALVGWAHLASAASFHSGDNVTTAPSQQIHDTLYAAGKTVDISSEVYGDIFCAGQTVNISGTVHGDVICAGQTVNVSGKVDGDVRLAGQSVTLSSTVSGNATIGGGTFVLDSNGAVGGDITVGSTDATINGPVGRDAVLGGNSAIIGSQIGRDINGNLANLKLAANARVGGDITLTSRNAIARDPGSVVTGKITRTLPSNEAKSKHGAVFGFGVAWFAYCFLAMLFTAIVLALLFPRLLQRTSSRAMPYPWKALLAGFVASFAVPVVIFVLAITIVGLPLAVLACLTWFVALLLSGPLFGYYIGRLIFPGSRNVLLTMLVGAIVLLVLYFIPIIGALAVLATVWIGTGMLLLEVFSRTPRPAYSIQPSQKK